MAFRILRTVHKGSSDETHLVTVFETFKEATVFLDKLKKPAFGEGPRCEVSLLESGWEVTYKVKEVPGSLRSVQDSLGKVNKGTAVYPVHPRYRDKKGTAIGPNLKGSPKRVWQ